MLVYTFKLNVGHGFSVTLTNKYYIDAVESLQHYIEPIDFTHQRGALLWSGDYTNTIQMLELIEMRTVLATALVDGIQFMREVLSIDEPLTLDWLRANVHYSQFYMELEPSGIVFDITPYGYKPRLKKEAGNKLWKHRESLLSSRDLTGRVKVHSAKDWLKHCVE